MCITMLIVMKKIYLILYFFSVVFAVFALCEEIEIKTDVSNVNLEHRFFIIKVGKDKGVEIGDGLIVHRDGEKIAEARIIKLRENLSAAEILTVEKDKEIKKGDSVLIVKKIELPKSDWAKPVIVKKPAVITVDINRDSDAVFSYTLIILRQEGFSVISSNKAIGSIIATQPISLSLINELWADAIAAIDHKLVVTFDIKRMGGASNLTLTSFKEHFQKGKHIKMAVMENTHYHNELTTLASKIKETVEKKLVTKASEE